MKKSQSIFLLSGLVPLVAAPIAIVASCSNDTTAVKSESQVEAERLNGLIQSSKIKILSGKETLNDAMLAEIKDTPNKLLNDYLDKNELALKEDKFTYNIIELAGVEPKQDANPQPKTLSFKFKVVNKTNEKEEYDSAVASVAYQYQAAAQPPTEPTPLEKAVKAIEDAHKAGTFKLKGDKKVIPADQIDQLTAANFLSNYVEGLPALESGLTASVKPTNFNISDKTTKDKTQVIKFKVTVSEGANKGEKDTSELTFEFTLQDPVTPPAPPTGGGGGSAPFSTKNNSK